MNSKKKCTRLGCKKDYDEEDNIEGSCSYHDGNPLFHDLKKGWTCCKQIVYDWDEFTKLQGCKIGKHTEEIQEEADFKRTKDLINNSSNSVNVSATTTNNTIVTQVQTNVKDITQYEAEQKKLLEEKKALELKTVQEPLKNKEGKPFCGNNGCIDKVFDPENNQEGSCKHHIGVAVFHDLKKFWSCCKVETWDWDEFMKIPPCATGTHIFKYKNK